MYVLFKDLVDGLVCEVVLHEPGLDEVIYSNQAHAVGVLLHKNQEFENIGYLDV